MVKEQIKKSVVELSKKVAATEANSTCCFLIYQDKVPDKVKKLRKF